MTRRGAHPRVAAPAAPARRDDFVKAHAAGRHEDALAAALLAAKAAPGRVEHWADATTACVYLARWEDAATYGSRALRLGGEGYSLHDALAHTYGALGKPELVRVHGARALARRDAIFGRAQVNLLTPVSPPVPSPQTRDRNLISFTLFGGMSRYCETAVINVQEARRLYPGWTCQFHVDSSVPAPLLHRLREEGAKVVVVDEAASAWPGPMWRLLAADEAGAHRVMWRDADAVVSAREAAAVQEWVASERRFHVMRDACTHTELILAGMWGCVGGSLPALRPLVDAYVARGAVSARFADQWFLREQVWPHARASLMSHDSQFGFMQTLPFGEPAAPGRHVGMDEGAASFRTPVTWPDGTRVNWSLSFLEGHGADARKVPVCQYPATAQGGTVRDHVPSRYLQRLRAGTAVIDIELDPRQQAQD